MALIFYILLGLLPSFTWLLFYLQEDLKHPEPKKLIFYTFLAGVIITVFVLQIQIILDNWTSDHLGIYTFPAFLIFAAVEELFKFGAVYFVVGHRRELDEPIDPMIYMIVAALGFSAVENVASVLKIIDDSRGVTGPLETTTLRFVGATLLHTLSSGLVGYYWGWAIVKKSGYFSLIIRGLILATLLHTFFNYFIISFEGIAVPIIFLVVVAFFILNDFEKLKRYN